MYLCAVQHRPPNIYAQEREDRELTEALKRGDESAMQRIFYRHYPDLSAAAGRIFTDQDTRNELAQEVLCDLWQKRERLDIRGSLSAYLRRAVINRALNKIKAEKRFIAESDAPEPSEWPEKERERIAEQEGLEQRLHTAMEALPEKCRTVFVLSRFERLSHKEIAEQLGISVKTIENQITKALKMLRTALRNHAPLWIPPLLLILANQNIGERPFAFVYQIVI